MTAPVPLVPNVRYAVDRETDAWRSPKPFTLCDSPIGRRLTAEREAGDADADLASTNLAAA